MRPQLMLLTFAAYLQVFDAELVTIHINGRQENGLHLVVS